MNAICSCKTSVKFIRLHGITWQKIVLPFVWVILGRYQQRRWIGKDLKGSGCALIDLLPSQYLLGGTEEKYGVPQPGFELSISGVQVCSLTATLTWSEVLFTVATVRTSNPTFLYEIIELCFKCAGRNPSEWELGRSCFPVKRKPCKVWEKNEKHGTCIGMERIVVTGRSRSQ